MGRLIIGPDVGWFSRGDAACLELPGRVGERKNQRSNPLVHRTLVPRAGDHIVMVLKNDVSEKEHGRTITLMSTELLAIRHGESYTNVNNEFSSRIVDHGLTQRGMEESTYTALWLSRCGVSAIYSSPLRRAKETAAIIGKTIGLDVIVEEALREVDVGSTEKVSQAPRTGNYTMPSSMPGNKDNGTFPFLQGESFAILVRRVRLFIFKT